MELHARAKTTKNRWEEHKSIPTAIVRDVVKEVAAEQGISPRHYAEAIKDWYLQKSDKLVVEVDGDFFDIPPNDVRVHNNDANAKAFLSYGTGVQVKIDGEIPKNYRQYRVQARQATGTVIENPLCE